MTSSLCLYSCKSSFLPLLLALCVGTVNYVILQDTSCLLIKLHGSEIVNSAFLMFIRTSLAHAMMAFGGRRGCILCSFGIDTWHKNGIIIDDTAPHSWLTFVYVMASCHLAISHCLDHCWRSLCILAGRHLWECKYERSAFSYLSVRVWLSLSDRWQWL